VGRKGEENGRERKRSVMSPGHKSFKNTLVVLTHYIRIDGIYSNSFLSQF